MQQTRINPLIHQELLESAPNAAAKGQAQYYTPTAWAYVLGLPLVKHRRHLVDLTAGNGQLLTGIADAHTKRFACDIDPVVLTGDGSTVTADLTKFQSLLREVKFEADLFALNPPWDLHWYRDRFADLAQSPCRSVAAAFAAHDGRTGRDTIDSTIATLCLAIDLCSSYGEGVLIANEATLQRLIFAPDAPHRALVNHIWAHLAIDGNICQPESVGRVSPPGVPPFRTGVIYFARSPQSGSPKHYHSAGAGELTPGRTLYEARVACLELQRERLRLRRGAETHQDYAYTEETPVLWQAAADEWNRLHGERGGRGANHWNIMLDPHGNIITDLSLFDHHAGRIPKDEVARLFALNGKNPMALVIQKAHRKELERAAFGTVWRVAPAVQQAVRLALKEYDAVRAPLRPLNAIQRLGYLDEHDEITCCQNLGAFVAGRSYPIRTLTIQVSRDGTKVNLEGELDSVAWTGSELCIYIKDGDGIERSFMESRLRGEDVTLSLPAASGSADDVTIDFTLQELAEHFTIPDVPDVATLNPELYQRNLALLHEIETIIA